jgi:hypothetical protein
MPNIDITSLGINANREVEIKTVIDEPPVRFFREVVSLRFTTGGMADRIAIQNNDDEAATFTGVFNCYDYSLASLTESLTLSDEAVIVTLDAPRQVREIHLPAVKIPGPNYSLEFYRLDGNTLSEKPTTIVSLEDNVATLPTDPDFTDIRFAIQLKDPDGEPIALNTSDIVAIHLRSYPTGPRLGIAPIATSESEVSDDLLSPVYFFQVPGEIREATSGRGEFSVGKELADALERHLDDYFALLRNDQAGSKEVSVPDTVGVGLVIESDAQCVLEITDFNISYRPVVQSLPGADGKKVAKQVLRFFGDQVSSQQVLVQVPRIAIVTSAVLNTVESFQSDRPLALSNGGVLTAPLTQNQGIFLGVEKWIAQKTTSAQAILASGIGLGLMSLAEKTELLLELREDGQGWPTGRKLAEGTIALEHVGRRGWMSLRFAEAVVISSKPHWIVIKAASGSALWLVQTSDSAVRVLEKESQRNGWAEKKVADSIQALYRLFCKTGDAQVQQQPATLTIGKQEVSGTRNENSDGMFDLKEALNDFLNMQPVDVATVTVPLTFTAVVPGIITVYPPSIEIDI